MAESNPKEKVIFFISKNNHKDVPGKQRFFSTYKSQGWKIFNKKSNRISAKSEESGAVNQLHF